MVIVFKRDGQGVPLGRACARLLGTATEHGSACWCPEGQGRSRGSGLRAASGPVWVVPVACRGQAEGSAGRAGQRAEQVVAGGQRTVGLAGGEPDDEPAGVVDHPGRDGDQFAARPLPWARC